MLKQATTLFVVYSILLVFLSLPGRAQHAPPAERTPATQPGPRAVDLRRVFDAETIRLRNETSIFDPDKLEAERTSRQVQKKGWSTKKKVLVISAIAVGIAALLFVAIKYGKECLRTEPENCSLGTDEYCTCTEYERRIPKGQ